MTDRKTFADLAAELNNTAAASSAAREALRFEYRWRHADHRFEVDETLKVTVAPSSWGGNGPPTMSILVRHPYGYDIDPSTMTARQLEKVLKLRVQVERWMEGFRPSMPTQAQFDEM